MTELNAVAIFFFILITLTTRSKTLGRVFAWREPIVELPWFGQWPGWPEDTRYPGSPGGYAYPAGAPMTGSMTYGPSGYVVQQAPGHQVMIQPGVNGAPPTVTQVPVSVGGPL